MVGRGKGGEVMRAAACSVIEAVALGGLTIINKDVAKMMESVDDNIKHPTVSAKLVPRKVGPYQTV